MNRMQGFSLIEGLIASVLLSLLVQIMLTLGVVLTKYQRQIEAKQAMVFEAQRYLALAQVSAQSIHHNDASHLEQILMQAFKNLTLQSDLPKVEFDWQLSFYAHVEGGELYQFRLDEKPSSNKPTRSNKPTSFNKQISSNKQKGVNRQWSTLLWVENAELTGANKTESEGTSAEGKPIDVEVE